ncbi:M23 family metallopeptidase [Patescibacteria group bacterium]|nr:M23 family metallopeptidase [Patescibacteria group bacterium]MBU1907335.1 M23 family metallopeptidase [Patescibacteria group bacterium]
MYRLGFLLHRHSVRVYVPAKDRILYVFSNRYAIHVAIVAIAAVVSTVNFSGSEVRAENFGERSTLYALVAGDDSLIVEEVLAEEIYEPEYSSYMGEGLIVSEIHTDEGYYEEKAVVTTIGGSSLMSPTISEADDSVAPRRDVETYVVQDGDTISSISQGFGISTSTVLWANNLGAFSYIRPGDELKIPPTSGVLHTVKSGDTLIKLANEYEADEEKILNYNKLASADDLVIGEEIMVPGGYKKVAVPAKSASSGSSSSGGSLSTYSGSYTGGTSGWIWPSPWRVITQYYGWGHTGLDIDCDYGVPNYAANNGVVSRAGWLGGYGLMVEVDHGGGYVTRYGHFSSLSVRAGQQVAAGQTLGMCGTTGRSTGTHLHFEVIKNGSYQNPLSYIR